MVKNLGLPPVVGYTATFAGGIMVTFLTPFAGMFSDWILTIHATSAASREA